MAWKIEVELSEKELAKIDRPTMNRIYRFLRDRLSVIDNPRMLGEPLKGELSGLWRYRVGDWRIIVRIEDLALKVVVIGIGHRRNIYE
jgi:mRNA interferase RelE/StbE